MAFFDSAGVNIHYDEHGQGTPVVLVHGFASRASHNWELTGWYKALAPQYRAVAMDCRGHGESAKPHSRADYSGRIMEDDVVRLLDHLEIPRALVMGYSMGARIAMGLLAHRPDRLRAVVLGGIGAGAGVTDPARRNAIVGALLAYDKSQIKTQQARLFRDFAEANKNDLQALAACMAADREEIGAKDFKANRVPVLIVVGSKDELVEKPERLTSLIPGAHLLSLDGRDHLNAPGDRRYKEAAIEFFTRAPE